MEKTMRPKRPRLRLMSDLMPGDVFRYQKSDLDDWHMVYMTGEGYVIYSMPNGTSDQNNKIDNIKVIMK